MDSTGTLSPLALLDDAERAFIDRVVAAARGYLGAHVGFLAEVTGEEKVVRHTAGPAMSAGVPAGARFQLPDTYCHRLLQGEIPEVIYDTAEDERALRIPLTSVIGIHAYMGVPVHIPGGGVLGTLCCINFSADPQRRERDLAFMRFLAGLIGDQVGEASRADGDRRRRSDLIETVLREGGPAMLYQPIVSLIDGAVVGMEALARFSHGPEREPDACFRMAWTLGLGVELELAAARSALAALPRLPPAAYLAINVSPATLVHPGFAEAIAGAPAERLVVEITEHAVVEDYAPLLAAMAVMRAAGIRIAVDDVGAGYSSLRHVLQVAPEMAKLDMSLTRGIHADPIKRALVTGVMDFAARAGLVVIAEGVETAAEADALRAAGVEYAQGFLFAPPEALPERS